MLFNSFRFAAFFSIFFALYWFVFNKNLKLQNLFLLIGSYVFYAFWDLHFLYVIVTYSLLIFIIGRSMFKAQGDKKKKRLLLLGLFFGLFCLVIFKYFNFFIDSGKIIFSFFHFEVSHFAINLILPLGLSFYVLRGLSYLIDSYYEKIEPTNDRVVFFSYIAFFPSLISGPIDRPSELIPQLENKRFFLYQDGIDGFRQILWGLFKKMVIANNCDLITKKIFEEYPSMPASTILLGLFFSIIQVYTDFSGYSDMAIGFARMLGFRIAKNFEFPFFATNIAEFWRKWHMSFTNWMTEYVFKPTSFYLRKYGQLGLGLSVLLTFILVGLWHGANWTFVIFGFLHGCYYLPLFFSGRLKSLGQKSEEKFLNKWKNIFSMIFTFILVMFTSGITKFKTITLAYYYYKSLFSLSLFSLPNFPTGHMHMFMTFLFIVLLLFFEWLQRSKGHVLQAEFFKRPILSYSIYIVIIAIIALFSPAYSPDYIYFQY